MVINAGTELRLPTSFTGSFELNSGRKLSLLYKSWISRLGDVSMIGKAMLERVWSRDPKVR
jgi:hypothetical protein